MENTDDRQDYRVLLVGHLFPARLEGKMLDQPVRPVQTQQFGQALLSALVHGFSGNADVLSVAPLLDYPACKLLLAPSAQWQTDQGPQATMIPYVNILGLKHLTRFIGTLVYVVLWSLRHHTKRRVIVMHGVQSCKIWGVLLGEILAPAITVSFITDGLGIPLENEGRLKRSIRRIDVFLMKRGLQRVSGVIAMTRRLAETLAPQKPVLLICTIHNPSAFHMEAPNKGLDDGVFTIQYAGRLGHDDGVDLLLKAFDLANRPDWRLVIAGVGPLEHLVRASAKNDLRIDYCGFVFPEELALLYRAADVLVNPRLTSSAAAALGFPSKLVEYLGTGNPVISTDLPTLDEAMRSHLVIVRSDTPEELMRCLVEVSSWGFTQRQEWQARTTSLLREDLSPAAQGEKIYQFIVRLSSQTRLA